MGETKAQKETDERAYIDFKNGIGFKSPDSLFFMNMRFRMQNRLGFNADDEFNIEEVEATVKRLRLRFDGFVLSPKLTYYLQLSFTLGDLGMEGLKNQILFGMLLFIITFLIGSTWVLVRENYQAIDSVFLRVVRNSLQKGL